MFTAMKNLDPKKFTIDDLISFLDEGKIVIPDFQRNYVWGNQQVLKLLDSIYQDWPIGNMANVNSPILQERSSKKESGKNMFS